METARSTRLTSLLLYTLAAALALVAAAGLGLRLAVAHADRFVPVIESLATEAIGEPVRVEGASGRMRGWIPELRFTGVSVGRGDTSLSLPAVTVTVSPWESLWSGGLRTRRLIAEGSALTLIREPGRGLLPAAMDLGTVPLALLPERLTLRDGVVRLVDPTGLRAVVLTGVRAELVHGGGEVEVAAEGDAPGVAEGTVRLAYRGSTDGADGRGHLNARSVRLPVLGDWLPAGLRPEGLAGEADLRLWSRRAGGRLSDVQGELAGRDLRLHGVTLDALAGKGEWRPTPEGWRLNLRDWRWAAVGDQGRVDAAVLARDADAWRFAAPRLRVAPLRALALAVPALPEGGRQVLEALEGAGTVTGLRAGLAGDDWRVEAALSGMAVSSKGTRPGISGLAGEVVAADRGGRLRLRAVDGALEQPALFREALPFDELSVAGRWRHRDDGRWRIHLPELHWQSADGELTGGAALWLGGAKGPFLDFSARLRDGEGARVPRYLPAGIMEDKLVDWLDQAFAGGRAPRTDVRFYGDLSAFPFRGGAGLFRVDARVEDVTFSFHPEWPQVRGSADLLFENERMLVRADAARYRDARLIAGTAEIPRMGKGAELRLDLEAEGPAADGLAFLRAAPITRRAPPILDALRVDDRIELSLGVAFPLGDPEAVEVRGAVDLDDALVTLADRSHRFSAVTGRIEFSERGLSWEALRGRFAGEAWESRARTVDSGDGTRVLVDTRLRAAPADLLPGREGIDGLAPGTADWTVSVDSPGFPPRGGEGPVRVAIRSDLRGVAVAAPPPLGKDAEQPRALDIHALLDGDGPSQPVEIRLGDALDARLRLDDAGELSAVAVGLGGGEAPALPSAGTRITGRLGVLRLAGLRGDIGAGVMPLPLTADLTLGSVVAGGFGAGEVDLSARVDGDGWRARLSGEAIAGELSAVDSGRLEARLAHLRLRRRDDADAPDPDTALRALPALSFEVGEMVIDERVLGRIAVELRAAGVRNRLQQLMVENDVLELSASGEADGEGVRLDLEASSRDVGAALGRFGYEGVLEGGVGELDATVSWPGRLTAPELAATDGRLSFTVTDSVVPSVEPGAGRVLGLFSLPLLPRRLLLDFSDVTDEGLAVDRVEGRFELADGILEPDEFFLEGPAGRIVIAGPVNLVEQTLDQTVTVTPGVSSALPVIGGLAGGPQTAILMFLAQRVFGEQMDRINRYQYRVTGPFEDPKVEPVKIERGDGDDNGLRGGRPGMNAR
ncbi:YhdP family protein [Arhodomonas sp. SL1]|uniref:YhdP family protein n=1 Tax=Arhodomonas sp. SL1 TaxID=3425691 RepID=UPI003F8811F0